MSVLRIDSQDALDFATDVDQRWTCIVGQPADDVSVILELTSQLEDRVRRLNNAGVDLTPSSLRCRCRRRRRLF